MGCTTSDVECSEVQLDSVPCSQLRIHLRFGQMALSQSDFSIVPAQARRSGGLALRPVRTNLRRVGAGRYLGSSSSASENEPIELVSQAISSDDVEGRVPLASDDVVIHGRRSTLGLGIEAELRAPVLEKRSRERVELKATAPLDENAHVERRPANDLRSSPAKELSRKLAIENAVRPQALSAPLAPRRPRTRTPPPRRTGTATREAARHRPRSRPIETLASPMTAGQPFATATRPVGRGCAPTGQAPRRPHDRPSPAWSG